MKTNGDDKSRTGFPLALNVTNKVCRSKYAQVWTKFFCVQRIVWRAKSSRVNVLFKERL